MSILSSTSSRIYTNTVDPTASETGVEVGNFFLNTASGQLFVNRTETIGAQVWELASAISTSSTGGTNNIVTRDANGNIGVNNIAIATTESAGGSSVVLTAASHKTQIFVGTGASSLTLPNATTLLPGWEFTVNNNTDSTVTVHLNDASVLFTIPSGDFVDITLITNITTNGTWDFHWSYPAISSNGQILIGSAAGPILANLTQGSGIAITNGAGSIQIATTTGGLSWVTVTGATQTIAPNTAYIANNAGGIVTFTLPATANVGDTFVIEGLSASGWTLIENTGQLIHFGAAVTTVTTGSLSSTNRYDCVTVNCVVANSTWTVRSVIGNLAVV